MERMNEILAEFGLSIQNYTGGIDTSLRIDLKEIIPIILNEMEDEDEKKEHIGVELFKQLFNGRGCLSVKDEKKFIQKTGYKGPETGMIREISSKIYFIISKGGETFVPISRNIRIHRYIPKGDSQMDEKIETFFPGYSIKKTFNPNEAEKELQTKLNEQFVRFNKMMEEADMTGVKNALVALVFEEFEIIQNELIKLK